MEYFNEVEVKCQSALDEHVSITSNSIAYFLTMWDSLPVTRLSLCTAVFCRTFNLRSAKVKQNKLFTKANPPFLQLGAASSHCCTSHHHRMYTGSRLAIRTPWKIKRDYNAIHWLVVDAVRSSCHTRFRCQFQYDSKCNRKTNVTDEKEKSFGP